MSETCTNIATVALLFIAFLISRQGIFPNTSCFAFIPRTSTSSKAVKRRLVDATSGSQRSTSRTWPISLQLRKAGAGDEFDHPTRNADSLCDTGTRNARILSPVSTAAAFFTSPLLVIADDSALRAQAPYVTRSFDTSREKYFPLSLPSSVISRRVLTTLSSLGGYLPNQYGTSNTLLGSTFCTAGTSGTKSDRSSLLGQIEIGLGKARFGSTSATIPLNSVGGVPVTARTGANAIQAFFSLCPRGGKAVLVYGPQIDISSTGYLSGSDQYGIGRSGIGGCGASAAVLNELRSKGAPVLSSAIDNDGAGWSVKALVTGQEDYILANLRANLLEANIDLSSSDQNYLLAEVTNKLYNLISDTLIADVDSCFKQKGFWNDVLEVVLLGGVVINRGAEPNGSTIGESYFKPVTFQSIHKLSDGTLESTNLLDNLFDVAYDELTLPGNNMDIKMPKVGLPDVSIPDIMIPDVSMPDIKIPDVSIPDVRVPDIVLPDIKLPHTGNFATKDRVSNFASIATSSAAATIVGFSGLLSYGEYVKKKEMKESSDLERKLETETKPEKAVPFKSEKGEKKAPMLLSFFSSSYKNAGVKNDAEAALPSNTGSAEIIKNDKDDKDEGAKVFKLPSFFEKNRVDTKCDTKPEASKEIPSGAMEKKKKALLKLPDIKLPSFFRKEAGRVQFDGTVSVSTDNFAVSLTKDLLTLSLATDRGQKASSLQQNTARNIIEQLESSAFVTEKMIFSPVIEGTWKLLYTDTYAFRSNPFFLARRSSCGDDVDLIQYYDASCVIFQGESATRTVGEVRQIVQLPLLISEVELFQSVLISTASLRAVTTSAGKVAWGVSLRSTQVKGSNPQVVRQLRDIKSMMTGVIPAPPFETTYLDDSLRISRDQDGNVFVFGKTSDKKTPSDYSMMAAAETTKLI